MGESAGGKWGILAGGQGRRIKGFRERKIRPRAWTHSATDGYYVALHQGTLGHQPGHILRLVEAMNSSHRNLTQSSSQRTQVQTQNFINHLTLHYTSKSLYI
ncbi:hypothetical protein MA16_Dca012451 [Dendrobium catenatum]|uniref:Uncharacterized protein n=1 Tax=Dendrobium catenatum TaxID=906689 RepID=A0A2I0XD15_9ASPA|nr:hypothetical protein MA16_Dca012451 [Dendrobium catenatum]